MHPRRRWRFVLTVMLLVVVIGCAQLPEYARPRFHMPENPAAASREGFTYRPLTVKDFKAPSLPSYFEQFNHHINAHSCISIRPSRESKARITPALYANRPFYVGSIPEIRFEAIFAPSCSWWNPDSPRKIRAYILEHEQIHFALAEIAARQLTIEAREEMKDFIVINATRQEVKDELSQKIKDLARDAMQASFEEHTAFDEDTSGYYNPRAQRWWLEDVKERLAATQPDDGL